MGHPAFPPEFLSRVLRTHPPPGGGYLRGGVERTVGDDKSLHSTFLIRRNGSFDSLHFAPVAQDDSTKDGMTIQSTGRTLSCHSEHSEGVSKNPFSPEGGGSFGALRLLRMTVRRTG